MAQTTQAKVFARGKQVIVGGGQVHKRQPLAPGYPIIATRGQGCRFWDADGREYIDYLCAYGPILLGYNHSKVVSAALNQARNGTIYNVGGPLEIRLAGKLVELIPSAETISLFTTGSECTSGAVKFARAYTGREKVVRCGYHGWHDWCQAGGRGVPQCAAELVADFRYNDLDSLASALGARPGEVACVIMEPAVIEQPEEGFLAGVKALCEEHGALLIFDEIKTGFRYALGGAQERFGVTPHLSTFGKALGNGWPIAAVVGQKQILEACEDVWVAATFNGEQCAIAAALATIEVMEGEGGIEQLWDRGQRLLDGLAWLAAEMDVDMRPAGAPPMPFLHFGEGLDEVRQRFYTGCVQRGVYFSPGHVWFMCLAHSDDVIEDTLSIAREALTEALK